MTIYLRQIIMKEGNSYIRLLEIFEGNIKEDKKYWKTKMDLNSLRYFKLEEVKN